MEENELYGKLFETIPLYTKDHLDVLIQSLTPNNAHHILIHAVKYGFSRNIYTLGECEVISKSIRMLTDIPPKETTEETTED